MSSRKDSASRRQLAETRAAVRDIRAAVERIVEAKAAMTEPLRKLAAIHRQTQPRTEFERVLFEIIRRGGSDAVTLGFACESAEIYCAEKLPAAAARERAECGAEKMHRVSEIVDGGAGVNLGLVGVE